MNFKNYITVIAVFFCLFNSLEVKAQTNYYVNDGSQVGDLYTATIGLVSNPGTAALPLSTLGDALALAGIGDTIYVDAGTYLGERSLNLNIQGLNVIGAGGSLTIFDNNRLSNTFDFFGTMTGDAITLQGFKITSYTHSFGATALIITNVTNGLLNDVLADNNIPGGGDAAIVITNSQVDFVGGGSNCNTLSKSVAGGGVNIEGANNVVTFTDYSFSSNNKDLQGGSGLYISGDNSTNITISNAIFADNINGGAIGGAALYLNGGAIVSIYNSKFENNITTYSGGPVYGGAIRVGRGGTLTLDNTTFTGNVAQGGSGRGGAIAVYSNSSGSGIGVTINIDTCSFDSNTANSGNGNDIYARVSASSVAVNINNSTFNRGSNNIVNFNTASINIQDSDDPNSTGPVMTGSKTVTNTLLPSATPIDNSPPLLGDCYPSACINPTPTGNTTQLFCALDSPTIADLVATAGTLVWYDAPANGNAYTVLTTPLVNGQTYYASDDAAGCDPSDPRLAVTVTILNPITPTITNAAQEFCALDNPTVADLLPSVYWYLSNGSGVATGSVLAGTVALVDGQTYVAVDSLGICESAVSVEVTVTIYNPTTPSITNASQEFCALDNPTVSDLLPSAYWYLSNGAGVATGSVLAGTIALVNGGTYVAVDSLGICESAVSAEVTVTIYNPTTPTITNASQEFCALDNPTVADLLPSAYWYLSNGAGAATGSVLAGTTPLVNTGTYVAIDSLGFCESVISAEVTVSILDTVPPTTVNTNQVFCASDNPTVADLVASGNNLAWYSTLTSTTALGSGVLLVVGEDYFGTQQNAAGCESSLRLIVNVIVSPLIIADAGNVNYTICAIDTVQIGGAPSGSSGSGALSYSWSPSTGLSNPADPNPFAFPSDTTTYILTVTDQNNCLATDTVIVNSSELPFIDATLMVIDSTNCGNSSGSIVGLNVTGVPFLAYSWSDGTSVVSNSLNLSNQTSGIYTLTVTDGNGCINTFGPLGINDIGGPVLDTNGLTLVDDTCAKLVGSISGITVVGGVGALIYTWQDATGDTISFLPGLSGVGAGIYILTVYDTAGCQSISGPYVLNEVQGPNIDQTLADVMDDHCTQSIGSITGIIASGGTGGLTYSWSDGTSQIGTNLDLLNLGAGNYTLTLTDAAGCQTSGLTENVLDINGPTIDTSLLLITPSVCSGNTGSFANVNAIGGVSPYAWQWFVGAALVDSTQNISGLGLGNYSVVVTDSLGCTDSLGVFTILNNPQPVIDITGIVLVDAVCGRSNGSISGLTVSGGTMPYSYLWYNGNGDTLTTLNVSLLAAGSYTLVVTDTNGCQGQQGPFVISNGNPPLIDLTGMVVFNTSCNLPNGSIFGVDISGGSGILTTVWDYSGLFFSNSLNISLLDTGWYFITVTDTLGCTAIDSIELVSQLLVTVDANDDFTSTLENTAVQIFPLVNDIGGISINILNGPFNGTASGNVLYTPNNSFYGIDTIQYEICDTVCIAICDTAFIYIEVTKDRPIRVFGGFSPNDDGINETFHIENIDLYPNNELIIYSRWGDQVYYAQPYNNEWDGSSQASGVKLIGDKVVDGTYYFVLKLTKDSEPINGFIDLRR